MAARRSSRAGQINGNGDVGAYFDGASADASRVFFSTDEQLVAADTDAVADIYQRFRGRTTLVSAGQINGNGDLDATFNGASSGGRKVFFTTDEKLVAADTDAAADIYERSGGGTKLVSAGQINGNGDFAPVFFRASADGSRALFETTERLVRADTDSSYDIYQRAFGATTLVSAGRINGNGDHEAFADAASTDGRRLFFRSAEPLVPADTDSELDEYEHFRGHTTLITAGLTPGSLNPFFFDGVTPDGVKAFFATDQSLVPADTDQGFDLYQRSRGKTRLITAARSAHP